MLGIRVFRPAAACVARREFHVSAAPQVRQKHLRRLNRLHKHWAKQMFAKGEEWVDPVLGKPNTPFIVRVRAMLGQTENQVDSLESEETSRLLYGATLATPQTHAHMEPKAPGFANGQYNPLVDTEDSDALKGQLEQHLAGKAELQREAVSRILALQNSNSAQSQKMAVKLAREEFARAPGDTGSPEVQAAITTVRIQFVAAHAKENKQDVQTKRRLEHMVQTRRNLLLYLKRVDPRRYIWTTEKLGLSDTTLSQEFHMSRKYLWRTQFYGEKTLELKKTRYDTKKQRDLGAKRARAERYLAQNDPEAFFRT